MNQPIAIQSWCYRHFKEVPAFIEQLKSTGVSATEICAVHADFSAPATFAKTIEQFKKADVKLVAIGVEYLSGNTEKDQPRFEFCKQAGIKHMSISFQPESMWDGLKNIEKLADQYDLKLSIHNHGGYDWLGNATILKYIFSKTSERIGLHLDTAWAIDAKQDPIKLAEQFSKRLYGVHVKDFVYDRARIPSDVIIGTGNLDLPKLMTSLQQMNFSGPLVIEYEGDEQNPVPALKKCVEVMKKVM
ncbi:MAG: sugar phosphate isomerase/epimerase [Anaerolineae bacterium]|nr:sugar phosphate isomerase/epimerase [Phycisphaerae bacterium]